MISNNSRADTFERCNREYFWNYEFAGTGIVPLKAQPHFSDGISIHAGLAELYRNQTFDKIVSAIDLEYKRGKIYDKEKVDWATKFVDAYLKRTDPVDDFAVLEVESEFRVVLGEICWKCQEPYAVTNIEQTKCIKCNSSLHWWVGRSDLNVKKDGGFKILDHKTTKGTANAAYLQSFDHSFQLIGYGYGVAKQNNIKVSGYGVNILKKLVQTESKYTNCGQCKSKGVYKKETCTRCNGTGGYVKEPSQLFVRKWFSLTPQKIERFVHTRVETLNQIENHKERFAKGDGQAFPMNAKACHLMRGGGECVFANLCWNAPTRADEWWDVSDAQIYARYELRDPDYVTLMEEDLD